MLFLSVCVLFSLCLSVGPARAAASVGGEINLMISYCGWCSLTAGESPGDAVSLLREQRRAQIISPAAFIYCSTYCCIIITPSSLPPPSLHLIAQPRLTFLPHSHYVPLGLLSLFQFPISQKLFLFSIHTMVPFCIFLAFVDRGCRVAIWVIYWENKWHLDKSI